VPRFDPLSRALGVVAALLGTVAAAVYWSAGLSLSHYDAKAHLVVARRILDSLTPSWEQIGAVWLPLPHVLNALPVQIDWMYQTGASAILISVVSFALTVASLSALVMRVTGSPWGAGLAAALFATNPNVLYLQSTPMTEPALSLTAPIPPGAARPGSKARTAAVRSSACSGDRARWDWWRKARPPGPRPRVIP